MKRTPKRNGLQNVGRFLLVSLSETWIWFCAGWLLGTVCVGGCREAIQFANNHGW